MKFSERAAGLVTACAALFAAGAIGGLVFAAVLFGDAGVLGVTAQGQARLSGVVPLLQCSLALLFAALARPCGRRAVMLGGLTLLIVGAYACALAGLVPLPSAPAGYICLGAALAYVSAGGAAVLVATIKALRAYYARSRWWVLCGGSYAVGLWGGWSEAATLGAAAWRHQVVPTVALWNGWDLTVTVGAPAWRLALLLFALVGLVVLGGVLIVWPRDDAMALRPDWWAVGTWSVALAWPSLTFVIDAPAVEPWVLFGLLLTCYALLHDNWRARIGVSGAFGAVVIASLGMWLTITAVGWLQEIPLRGTLPELPLLMLAWAAPLVAAGAAPWQVRGQAMDEGKML